MRLTPEVSLMLVLTLGCGSAIFAGAAPQPLSTYPIQPKLNLPINPALLAFHTPPALSFRSELDTSAVEPATSFTQDIDWDTAFADNSGLRPLHFIAQYQDIHGTHHLEEWRTGLHHLRRRTDDRIDLHADATTISRPGLPTNYLWQIIDLQKKIDNRISSDAMLKTGMFYSFYSMAHVITRPAGRFHLTQLHPHSPTGLPSDHSSPRQELSRARSLPLTNLSCTWYELSPEAQPATRVCWSSELAIPLETQSHRSDGTWQTDFTLQTFDRAPIPPTTYVVNTINLQIRNHDEMANED